MNQLSIYVLLLDPIYLKLWYIFISPGSGTCDGSLFLQVIHAVDTTKLSAIITQISKHCDFIKQRIHLNPLYTRHLSNVDVAMTS